MDRGAWLATVQGVASLDLATKPPHHAIPLYSGEEATIKILYEPQGFWIAKRSNQSILKEMSPEYSLEGLMLKLKLQYFGHLMQRTDSLERTLMLG